MVHTDSDCQQQQQQLSVSPVVPPGVPPPSTSPSTQGSGKRTISQIEVEGSTPKYEGTFDDYLEMFIQFGYVTLFRLAKRKKKELLIRSG